MISGKCLTAYMEMYPENEYPKSIMHYLMCDGRLSIATGTTPRIQPDDETDETFMERLSRCTPERNVFLEEWPEDTYDYANSQWEI